MGCSPAPSAPCPGPLIRRDVPRGGHGDGRRDRAAVRFLSARQGLRVEPSGAVTSPPLLAGKVTAAGPGRRCAERRQRGPGAVRPIGGGMSMSPRILVADDDQALTRTLSWILKENGYDVVTVPDGEHLLDRLDTEQYRSAAARHHDAGAPTGCSCSSGSRAIPASEDVPGPDDLFDAARGGDRPRRSDSAPPTSSPSPSGCGNCWRASRRISGSGASSTRRAPRRGRAPKWWTSSRK